MTRIAFLALLALAACKAAPDPEAANQADVENQLNAPVKEVETLPPDETAVVQEPEHNAPVAPAPTSIPESMQGRWGLVPADCTSTRGDAKGLLTVTGDTLQFYESRAKLTKMIGSWPEKLTAEFAFTGEGQSWTKTETLALTGSSNALVRTEDGRDFRYLRCAR